MMDYSRQYQHFQHLVENALSEYLPLTREDWPEDGIPKHLSEAMRYSLLSGGKRIRPVLLLAAFQAVNADVKPALPFAVALECIHCYSLIHDDLPAMDDDDLRRGQPTNHKVFGEAMAILAGDALLNFAFELMASCSLPGTLNAMREVSKYSGSSGMIAGQTADIHMAGEQVTPEKVAYIHRHKTADLITSAVVAGLILGGADARMITHGKDYAFHLGLAFQITDDLLDLEGEQAVTGKAGQRDAQLGKLTWPAAVGIEKAREDAQKAIDRALAAAEHLGQSAGFFKALALSIPKRVK